MNTTRFAATTHILYAQPQGQAQLYGCSTFHFLLKSIVSLLILLQSTLSLKVISLRYTKAETCNPQINNNGGLAF